jgi:hypothetical protein
MAWWRAVQGGGGGNLEQRCPRSPHGVVAVALHGPRFEQPLHAPVLEGVVRDDDQAPPGTQAPVRAHECLVQRPHLVVDADTQRLKAPREGLRALLPRGDAVDDLDQVRRGHDGPGRDDFPRDLPGPRFFPEMVQGVGDFVRTPLVDDGRRGEFRGAGVGRQALG